MVAFHHVNLGVPPGGVEVFDGIVGVRVALCRDPAGNRWELRSA